MIKRFAQCLREYKWTALVSPVCMIGEVAMEVLIPLVMADLYDYGIKLDDFDPDGDNSGDTAKVPNDYAQSIIDSLDQKYPDHSSTSTAVGPVIPGDYDTFMITTEADSNS